MRKYYFFFLLTGTFVMLLVMTKTGAPLKTAGTPNGIIDLEFAYNNNKAAAVINTWKHSNKDNITTAKINTELDFIFIFFYSLFLHLSCKTIAALFEGAAQTAGLLIAAGAIAAGIFDVLENTCMLITLQDYKSPAILLATFIFSLAKWLLAAICLLYLLAGSIWLLIKKSGKL